MKNYQTLTIDGQSVPYAKDIVSHSQLSPTAYYMYRGLSWLGASLGVIAPVIIYAIAPQQSLIYPVLAAISGLGFGYYLYSAMNQKIQQANILDDDQEYPKNGELPSFNVDSIDLYFQNAKNQQSPFVKSYYFIMGSPKSFGWMQTIRWHDFLEQSNCAQSSSYTFNKLETSLNKLHETCTKSIYFPSQLDNPFGPNCDAQAKDKLHMLPEVFRDIEQKKDVIVWRFVAENYSKIKNHEQLVDDIEEVKASAASLFNIVEPISFLFRLGLQCFHNYLLAPKMEGAKSMREYSDNILKYLNQLYTQHSESLTTYFTTTASFHVRYTLSKTWWYLMTVNERDCEYQKMPRITGNRLSFMNLPTISEWETEDTFEKLKPSIKSDLISVNAEDIKLASDWLACANNLATTMSVDVNQGCRFYVPCLSDSDMQTDTLLQKTNQSKGTHFEYSRLGPNKDMFNNNIILRKKITKKISDGSHSKLPTRRRNNKKPSVKS
ncbi:MAG: hypothetical protein ACON5A_05010 [Candidatus Comchoanobacterales bacterium]